MRKTLLSTVVFFALLQPAYAWDWLERQVDALPDVIPSMTELYGMEKKISPNDMVIEEEGPADKNIPAKQGVQFKSPEETISGEKRMVLFHDEEDVTVIKSEPATKSNVVRPKQPPKPPVEIIVPNDTDAVLEGDGDYVIRSQDYYQQQVTPPPAVFKIVEAPLDEPEAAADTETVTKNADMISQKDEVSFAPEERAAQGFIHCQGYGCRVESGVYLSKEEWQLALRAFNLVPIENPTQERMAIAIYIGEMEKIVGAKTDTLTDVGGTFSGFAKAGQLDCQDEATNTGTYLSLLDNEGLLKFHAVGKMAGRGFFTFSGGWPHQSATIVEKDSGQVYAVDSWFEDNGVMPYILPIEQWKSGWSPGDVSRQQEETMPESE